MKLSNITIAVVCRNEEHHIESCIHSLVSQTLKPKEILIIDNGSTDKTPSILLQFQKLFRYIRIINEPTPSISKCRNIAVKNTNTPLIAFIDADCVAPKHWLQNLYTRYIFWNKRDVSVVAVGGSNIPPSDTLFHKILKLLLNSYLGTGTSIQGRVYINERYISHIPCVNVLFSKQAVQSIGGFDETFGSIIEDEDLTYRLKRRGYTFVYIPNATVIHDMTSSIGHWIKKMFLYGKGRAWFIKKYPETISPKSIVPLLLILIFLLSAMKYRPGIILLCMYASAVMIESIYIIISHGVSYIYVFFLLLLYISTHIAYGFGLIYGLCIQKPRHQRL